MCKPYGSAFTVGIAGCVICVIECYCDAVGSAVARLIVVDTVFHITFDSGNTAAIGRTAEITHNYNLLFFLLKFFVVQVSFMIQSFVCIFCK